MEQKTTRTKSKQNSHSLTLFASTFLATLCFVIFFGINSTTAYAYGDVLEEITESETVTIDEVSLERKIIQYVEENNISKEPIYSDSVESTIAVSDNTDNASIIAPTASGDIVFKFKVIFPEDVQKMLEEQADQDKANQEAYERNMQIYYYDKKAEAEKRQAEIEEAKRSGYVIELTDSELLLLAKMCYNESRGECREGQVAVCAVAINRVQSDNWPNNIHDVLYQSGQFANFDWVSESQAQTVMSSVIAALNGEDPTTQFKENGCFYFNGKAWTNVGHAIGNQMFH